MRRLASGQVAEFVRDVLYDPARREPVVAITTQRSSGAPLLDPERLAAELAGIAQVVLLETGDATWELAEALPPRLDVYGGAARIWWPGLTPESDPYEHRLYFLYGPADAEPVRARILDAIRGPSGAGAEPGPDSGARAEAEPARPEPPELPPEPVRVTGISSRIEVAAAARHGVIVEADMPLGLLAGCVVDGLELQAKPLRELADGSWEYSLAGLLPNAWQRLADEVQVGDVLVGRVQNVVPARRLVFVDVLPGVVGICHASELDYHRVDAIEGYARPGELLPFQVILLEPATMTLQLSRKRAYGQDPRPSPSLLPGGRPFVWRERMPMFESLRRAQQRGGGAAGLRILPPKAVAAAPAPSAPDRIAELTAEADAAANERVALAKHNRELSQQNMQLRKEKRSAEDRYEALQRRVANELDPLATERAFLLAVRTCHARTFDEQDRFAHPLRRMRVGASFLRTLRELDGIDVDKVVEVCTQVAAGVASSVPAREVHQLRDGPRGAGNRTRASDGAKAWRCSLQDNTASARRLHWWSVPGPDGGVIEFASVGVHDDFSIPE